MKLGAGRRKSLNEISLERWDTVVKRKKDGGFGKRLWVLP